jgi:acetyl esterase/lipase
MRVVAAEVMREIPYASASNAQKLDLHLPQGAGDGVPVIVEIHGGAFFMGDKTMNAEQIRVLVDAGYAVAAVNYRLSGEARFPAAVQDVKAAVRFLRANAAAYGLDPHRVGAFGGSAGGYLASMLGVTGSIPTFDDPSLGNPDQSSAVQAMASWFAPIDFLTMDEQHRTNAVCIAGFASHDAADSPESRWMGAPIQTIEDKVKAASPLAYIESAQQLPPFYLEHGDQDCHVPAEQTAQLAAALKTKGANVTHRVIAGAGHATSFPSTQELPSVVAFFEHALKA